MQSIHQPFKVLCRPYGYQSADLQLSRPIPHLLVSQSYSARVCLACPPPPAAPLTSCRNGVPFTTPLVRMNSQSHPLPPPSRPDSFIYPPPPRLLLQERRSLHDPPGTYEGQTALHIAIVNRDMDMVKFLVQVGVVLKHGRSLIQRVD